MSFDNHCFHTSNLILYCRIKRGTSLSAPEYSLSLKKPPTVNTILTRPKLGPKKTVLIIALRIALTLDVKFVWFGRQGAVCVQKRHKNAIIGCSLFQRFNFDCLLLKLLIGLPKNEKHIKICVFFVDSVIFQHFRDLSIFGQSCRTGTMHFLKCELDFF